jgi:hypothetical protein
VDVGPRVWAEGGARPRQRDPRAQAHESELDIELTDAEASVLSPPPVRRWSTTPARAAPSATSTLLLLDAHNVHFTVRTLIVGASRVARRLLPARGHEGPGSIASSARCSATATTSTRRRRTRRRAPSCSRRGGNEVELRRARVEMDLHDSVGLPEQTVRGALRGWLCGKRASEARPADIRELFTKHVGSQADFALRPKAQGPCVAHPTRMSGGWQTSSSTHHMPSTVGDTTYKAILVAAGRVHQVRLRRAHGESGGRSKRHGGRLQAGRQAGAQHPEAADNRRGRGFQGSGVQGL